MGLLQPESGLIVWMVLAFGVVFFLLVKYGFPAITGMVEKQRKYVEDSMQAAEEANARLAGIQKSSEALLAETRVKQAEIMRQAQELREEMLKQAREEARAEGARQMEEMRRRMEAERAQAMRRMRDEIVSLSVGIASRLLNRELESSEAQAGLIDEMLEKTSFPDKKPTV